MFNKDFTKIYLTILITHLAFLYVAEAECEDAAMLEEAVDTVVASVEKATR